MAAKTLRELFVEELRDMYDGEKQLTRALTKMAKASESAELQTASRVTSRKLRSRSPENAFNGSCALLND